MFRHAFRKSIRCRSRRIFRQRLSTRKLLQAIALANRPASADSARLPGCNRRFLPNGCSGSVEERMQTGPDHSEPPRSVTPCSFPPPLLPRPDRFQFRSGIRSGYTLPPMPPCGIAYSTRTLITPGTEHRDIPICRPTDSPCHHTDVTARNSRSSVVSIITSVHQ